MAAERYTPSISFSAFVALANMRYIKVLNNNNNNNNNFGLLLVAARLSSDHWVRLLAWGFLLASMVTITLKCIVLSYMYM